VDGFEIKELILVVVTDSPLSEAAQEISADSNPQPAAVASLEK